ncbi:hypothetical protein C942_00260 [Photobacterium marinum]|uniref:Uncharacterized protein n=2 Tax=Photobacterium marinum TaxID=1056511 RepID=L8JKJ2_9GAMM|nr:hypothetical protein C942_00260 [Photobacterium marinum]
MKTEKIIICLAALLFAHNSYAQMICPKIKYEKDYKSNLPTLDEDEIINKNKALIPGGELTCKVSFSYKTLKNNKRYRIEEGLHDGVKYRIFFSDGSGSIQGLAQNKLDYVNDKLGTNWSMRCDVDGMDDSHWCSIDKGDLRVGIWKDGTFFVSVGSNHYPNSKVVVRINKNKPISASENIGFTKEKSIKIIEQLESGSSVLTRYQEWPYQSNIDTSTDLFGFSQAWFILQKVYESVGEHK